MKQFNVLDRHVSLHQHHLLEASAGTGKTFSIQNILVRLLIEPLPSSQEVLVLPQILALTFTKAATRDLKARIRLNLEFALEILQKYIYQSIVSSEAPDYLLSCMEKGYESALIACKRLQEALFLFDQAQIFTIHSFCARMLKRYTLESDVGFQMPSDEKPLPYSELIQIIRDFFRTEMRLEKFSPSQLDKLLRGDPDQKKLFQLIQTGFAFPAFSDFKDQFLQFVSVVQTLKKELFLEANMMIEDFENQFNHYKNDDPKRTKKQTLEKIHNFAHLFDVSELNTSHFDQLIADGLIWVRALDPELLKKNGKTNTTLHYPKLFDALKAQLLPIITEASDFSILLLRLAKDCQKLLHRFQFEEEKLTPDDILRKMHKAIAHPEFSNAIRLTYHSVIVDEFQDTDPLQWQIFQELFLDKNRPWNGYLYLVGDPKQSIYSFRQADIYTYLKAAQALGDDRCFSLNVNYRSQANLVDGLNLLFSQKHVPCLFRLPKTNTHLCYQPVLYPENKERKEFQTQRGAVHFFMADVKSFKNPKLVDMENHIFFPFIANEIIRLVNEKGLKFSQFAVLVRDRYQALRLADYFEKMNVAYINQRGTSLANSVVLQPFVNLIRAVLRPHHPGILKTALGTSLFGLTHEDILGEKFLDDAHRMMHYLRWYLMHEGFHSFLEKMLNYRLLASSTIKETLLLRDDGVEILRDLEQIADVVIDHYQKEWTSPEGIVKFLDQFHLWDQNDDDRVKRFQDLSQDGVKILTLHFSKGLEFDVVFALGLLNRIDRKEEFITAEVGGVMTLQPISYSHDLYVKTCEENDAEKMRQLYVALTRAKYQLYIPFAINLPSDRLELAQASPLDLFVARIGEDSLTSEEQLYQKLRKNVSNDFISFLDRLQASHLISYSIEENALCSPFINSASNLNKPILPPKTISIQNFACFITSFSSLSQKASSHALNLPLKEEIPPRDFTASKKTIHTLPAHYETGLWVHELLEKIDYKQFAVDSADDLIFQIDKLSKKSHLIEWNTVASHLVFNAWNTPFLALKDKYFSLTSINDGCFYREMPFIYPFESEVFLEEITREKGFIKGVIDLVFYHAGKYFLLDWKTNWFGPSVDYYSQELMEKAMHDNHYFLQANIYKEALRRYLKLVDSRSFEECFGGTYYIFLRGLNSENANGVFFFSN